LGTSRNKAKEFVLAVAPLVTLVLLLVLVLPYLLWAALYYGFGISATWRGVEAVWGFVLLSLCTFQLARYLLGEDVPRGAVEPWWRKLKRRDEK
jgi:L-lactate permease